MRWTSTCIAMCVLGVAACGGSQQPAASHRSAPTSTDAAEGRPAAAPIGHIAAVVPVPEVIGDVAAGGGWLWVDHGDVTGSNDWSLSRIDPKTNTISGRAVLVGNGRPAMAGSTGGLLVSGDGVVVRLDPRTQQPDSPSQVCGQPSLAGDASSGDVWTFETADCGELARYSSSTGAKEASIPVASSTAISRLAVGDGQAWMIEDGTLNRVAAGGRTVKLVRPVGESVSEVGVGDGVAWWIDPSRSARQPPQLTRISDRTLASLGTTPMTGPTRLEQGAGGLGQSFVTGDGRIWTTYSDGQHAELAAFDLQTGEPAGMPVALTGTGGEIELAFAFGSVWVTGKSQVLRVKPSPCCTDIGGEADSQDQAAAPGTAPSKRPGCSTFCQQAGPEGGPKVCAGNCPPCPADGCMAILSHTAQVVDDLVPVEVECHAAQACKGAFLLLPPDSGTGPNGSDLPRSQWVAGSDIDVPAGSTATVYVKLTELGKRLVSASGGYRAEVSVVLDPFGGLELTYAESSLLVHR